MKPTTGYRALVERAEQKVKSLSPEKVTRRLGKPGVLLVDLRDVR